MSAVRTLESAIGPEARAVFDNLLEGCQIVSPDFRYVYVNEAAAAQAGRPIRALVGRTMMECYPGVDRTPMFAVLSKSMTERVPQRMADELSFPDGTKTYFELSFVPVAQGVCVLSLDITEQRRAVIRRKENEARLDRALIESEQVRQRSERRFARLSEAGIIGVVISDMSDRSIVEINDALLSMIGYTRADVASGALRWSDLTPPEFHALDERAVEQLAASTTSDLREKEYVRKDGTRVAVLIGTAMLDDGTNHAISFVLDLTERKEAAAVVAQLRAERTAEASFRAVVEGAPDAIVIAGEDDRIVIVNAQAERVFGYPREKLIGRPISMLAPPQLRVIPSEHRVAHYEVSPAAGPSQAYEMRGQRSDGSEFPIEITLSPLRTETRVFALRAIRDITERKRTEESLRLSEERLKIANQELEAFSYSVAHDLRAPLRGMSGFAQLLVESYGGKLDDEGRDWLNEITLNAHKMSELIDALLSLSRFTRVELAPKWVDLGAIATSSFSDLRAAEPQRNVELVCAEALSAEIDPGLARALVQNLVGNAWKFTSKTSAARIEVGAREDGEERVFFVRDDGAGFDMAFANKLFAPFQRLHTVTEFPGTGIGLANAQRIVHRHGGRIWAEGTVGGGATFYFTLPSRAPEQSHVQADSAD